MKTPPYFLLTLLGFLLVSASYGQNPEPANLPSDAASYPYWQEMMHNPEANFYETQAAFEAYWANRDMENGHGWKQYKRWEWFMEPRVYPKGHIPQNAYYAALQEAQQSKSVDGNWSLLGPFDVPYTYGGSPRGLGRINCVAFHPTDANTLWVGAPSGGFWKSTDGGSSWTTTTDHLGSIGVSDIAVHPTNPDILYIATGDGDAGDTYSIGVLKSEDGGATWNPTGLAFATSSTIRARRLLINPNNANILLVSTNSGIYRTTDGGANWSNAQSGYFKDMEFKPGNPDVVYATSYYSAQIYKSTNGGVSFNALSTGIPSASVRRIELAVTPNNANVVYAVSCNDSDSGLEGIYKSTDSGSSWTKVYGSGSDLNLLGWDYDGTDAGGQGWYDLTLVASPTNANEVYVGGVNVWKSTNGGSSWALNAHWYGGGGAEYVHADHHAMAYSPSGVLFSGNDGGLYKTSDGGTNWIDISDGLHILQIYRMGNATTNGDIVITGSQDNGTMKRDATNWHAVIGGDGMECIIDYTNSNIMYGSLYYGDIRKTTDGGYSWSQIKPSGAANGAWVTPYIMDPSNSSTLYAGYEDVWKTSNGGSSWTQLSSNLTGGSTLRAMAIAPSNTDYLYVSDGYDLYRTSNGGSTWTNMTNGTISNTMTYIAVHPTQPQTLWLTLSGYDSNRILKSTDGGSSWSDYSTGLPQIPANCVVYENGSNDMLYIGTDVGVYCRDNGMSSWQNFSNQLPNVVVNELEIHYGSNRLRAATYGRGLWESDLYDPGNLAPVANFSASSTSIGQGATVDFTDLSSYSPTEWAWSFPGAVPSTSTAQNPTGISYPLQGTFDVTLTATNANGTHTTTKTGYITVGAPTYCEVSCDDGYEYISNVSIGSINNSSTTSGTGYQDFTSSSTDVELSGSESLVVSVGSPYSSDDMACWVDWNQDYDFDDAGEEIAVTFNSSTGTGTATVNVPATAAVGETRMRIRLQDLYYTPDLLPCGESSYGEVEDYTLNVVTVGAVFEPPVNLQASIVNTNDAMLVWDAPGAKASLSGYQIYRNSSPVGGLLPSSQTSYLDAGLAQGTYDYCIKAEYGSPSGVSDCSNTASVNVVITSAEQPDDNKQFHLYPNPNNGIFTVEALDNETETVQLKVYNMSGQLVYSSQWNTTENSRTTVDLSAQSKGMYHVELTSENQIVNYKVAVE